MEVESGDRGLDQPPGDQVEGGSVTILPWVLLFGFLCSEDLDARVFLDVLEASIAPLEDYSLEYEGSSAFPRTKEPEKYGPGGLYSSYSAKYLYRLKDNAFYVDIFHRNWNKNTIVRETMYQLNNKYEIYQRNIDSKTGKTEIHPASPWKLTSSRSFARLDYRVLLRAALRSGEYRFRRRPPESIEGRECEVVELELRRLVDGRETVVGLDTYWVDLQRQGCVLRAEKRVHERRLKLRITHVLLHLFKSGLGREFWLPVHGELQGFTFPPPTIQLTEPEPDNVVRFDVLKESVVFNSGLKDSMFSVRYPVATLITDHLKKSRYEFGQQRQESGTLLTKAEAETLLASQLRAAEEQRSELKAASVDVESQVEAWLPWLIAAFSFIALVVVWSRNRNR
mgnify:CR=1 FL=1